MAPQTRSKSGIVKKRDIFAPEPDTRITKKRAAPKKKVAGKKTAAKKHNTTAADPSRAAGPSAAARPSATARPPRTAGPTTRSSAPVPASGSAPAPRAPSPEAPRTPPNRITPSAPSFSPITDRGSRSKSAGAAKSESNSASQEVKKERANSA
ncbi:hypothetical protein MMC28_004936 [Mycoblastus sanguinarius]|nr:hypothetical protein [Mycoblastus sanguinarius]